MSLTNRLSLFFLAALALVLVGFSLTIYYLASRYLFAHADQRLESAMQALIAAIEIHPGDVEWEPLQRRFPFGEDASPDQPRWAVHNLEGRLIDCSINFNHADANSPSIETAGWRIQMRRMRGGSFQAEPYQGRNEPNSGVFGELFPTAQVPGTVELPRDRTFRGDGLILTAAVNEGPVRATLQRLASSMTGVSAAIWLSAAILGRWLCRRALAPITRMATSARTLQKDMVSEGFLDVAPTRDELEDLGRAFNDLLAGLREALECQRRFAGDASHQLRTPVTALLASVEVSLREDRSPAEYQRVLQVVRRRAGQLRQIIESLLFLARPDAAASLPELQIVDLNEWCLTWLSCWAEHPRYADIQVQAAANPAWVQTQPVLLGQILDNLLDNACKYSEAGSPIIVAVSASADAVTLTVSDRGCGIPPEELTAIFEPFYRARNARWLGKSGAGLGLAMAQRLVAVLGGTLDVRSEPGQGSHFRVTFPPAVNAPKFAKSNIG